MKYIICDMSGIVSIKGKNNTELLAVFKKLKNIKFTFCTGKGFKGSLDTIKELNLSLPIICENGSLLVTKTGEVVSKHIIDFKLIKNLILKLSSLEYEFISCCNIKTNNYIFLNNRNKLKEELKQDIFFGEEVYYNVKDYINAIKDLEIVRIIYRGNTISKNILNSINGFDISNSEQEYYSFCLKNVNKKSGVEEIINRYNISNCDIIIVGNDFNDICMFDMNCYEKIAVGNKCHILKELADVNISLKELPNYLSYLDKNIKK